MADVTTVKDAAAMTINGKKFCPRHHITHGEWLTVERFHKDKQTSDGLAAICRDCRKIYKEGVV